MAFRNFKYYMSEATSGMAKNSFMTIASLVTVTGCLLLFGIVMLISININYLGEQIQAQCEISAFIEDTMSASDERRIYDSVCALENVKSVTFETKDEAWRKYIEYLGNGSEAFEGMNGEEIMRSSVRVTLNDLALADDTASQIAAIDGVASVQNRRDIVKEVLSVTRVVRVASLIAMLFLLIIAIFIISNAIKMSVHSREEAIHIMRYVGATDTFIRWPFVIEGVAVGVIGAVVALCITFVGYGAIINSLHEAAWNIFTFRPLHEVAFSIGLTVICFGVLMGAVGSLFSIKKHLEV